MFFNKIGIIGAMEEEVAQIKGMIQNLTCRKIASMEFYSGIIEGKDVVIVRSGIGKVNAAICTQILVDLFNVDAIINSGIAGSLRDEINICDMVLSIESLQHDVDATNFGYDLGVIPRMEQSIFPADTNLIDKAEQICKEHLSHINVHRGRVLSGDQFIADNTKKEWLLNNFKGYCTEMEGAAIAQVCYLNNIPYLIIRSISDKADNSASMEYSEFENAAIKNTVILLHKLLKVL